MCIQLPQHALKHPCKHIVFVKTKGIDNHKKILYTMNYMT